MDGDFMKTYEVLIKSFCTVVIEAEDAESATTIACDEVRMGDFQLDEGGPAKEIEGDENIVRAMRHADRVMKTGDWGE